MKILLPVDGSSHSDRAVQHAITAVGGCAGREIHAINVQEPIDAPELLSHMPMREIEAMQQTRGGDALVSARGCSTRPVSIMSLRFWWAPFPRRLPGTPGKTAAAKSSSARVERGAPSVAPCWARHQSIALVGWH